MSMTKEQLITENQKLNEKIEQQSHLADAVNAKDEEIRKLKVDNESARIEIEELKRQIAKAQATIDSQSHLASAVEAKDIEIARLKKDYTKEITEKEKLAGKDFETQKAMHDEQLKRIDEETKKVISQYEAIIKRKDAVIILLKSSQDSFFKNIQGALENAINLAQYTNREE